MKTVVENMGFTSFADGIEPSDYFVMSAIAEVQANLMRGEIRSSISTGNFAVIGIAYDSEYQIYVTNNYSVKTIYK